MRIFLLLCLYLGMLSGCLSEKPLDRVQFLMGTHARIVLYNGTNDDIDDAFSKMRYLEGLMSDYDQKSELSRINRYAGKNLVDISDELKEVLEISIEVARETEGAFDPTIGALTIGFYGFGREDSTPRKFNNLNEVKKLVDYRLLSLHDNEAFLEKEGMMLDLGGIGKGFAVDKAVVLLKKRGITKGSVSISGDLRVFGNDQIIYVKHPRREGFIASFTNGEKDLSISTSGDYERRVNVGGKSYHHILVPEVGSSGNDFQSITLVMEGNSVLSDAYSTALFAMGRKRAINFLENHSKIGAFIVFSDGGIFYNERFEELVTGFRLIN
ncbi:MAG: FAD:protein FMN transferase [Thermodesulfobacteriota bacterium]